MGMEAATNVVLELGARGLFRVRDLKRRRISPNWMPFFEWRYGFVSHGRGVWSRRDFKPTRYELVQCRFPKSVFWGPSALWLLGHLEHEPSPLWLAIDNKAATPKLDYPPLRLVRFSGAALTEGVEEHVVDGVTVCVTGVAKTVTDCFKYRNKIGLDVALEALREAWSAKRMTSDQIWHYAKIDRVANVMRPYLESLA